jgi:hypothetical protein
LEKLGQEAKVNVSVPHSETGAGMIVAMLPQESGNRVFPTKQTFYNNQSSKRRER